LLDAEVAQEIADRLAELIGHNVLLANEKGIVVGSSDLERVGTFHEPSIEAIKKKITTVQSSTTHFDATKQSKGAKPGLTLALMLGDKVVGAVAITGNPAEVDKFGMIIKSQTEIMLREAALLESTYLKESALQNLLHDVANYNPAILEPDALVTRAGELGYDLNLERVAIIMYIPQLAHMVNSQNSTQHEDTTKFETKLPSLLADILRSTRDVFNNSQDLVASIGIDKIAILHRVEASNEFADRKRIRSKCKHLIKNVEKCQSVHCSVGIGTVAKSVSDLRWSYYDARNALLLGKRLAHRSTEFHIDEFRTQELLLTTSRSSRERFLNETLEKLRSQTDWADLRRTILTWCESGYSPVGAAKTLHIHRNTLLYRLDKIEKLNGESLRDHKRAIALYLACLLDELDPDKGVA
jgi:carbohydrate diacid regulator